MAARADRAIAHERRRAGETALSKFAEYVEQQQLRRKHPIAVDKPSAATQEEHDELDILETLGLSDENEQFKLKEMLLHPTHDNRTRLKELLSTRISEGRGEALFDIGTENNGESMCLTKEEYTTAFISVRDVSKDLNAGVKVLLTTNVGEETDVETTTKVCSSKVLVRRRPDTMDELLEIRVAVVGNGMYCLKLKVTFLSFF
jgi:hypothetical protein